MTVTLGASDASTTSVETVKYNPRRRKPP